MRGGWAKIIYCIRLLAVHTMVCHAKESGTSAYEAYKKTAASMVMPAQEYKEYHVMAQEKLENGAKANKEEGDADTMEIGAEVNVGSSGGAAADSECSASD